MTLAERTVGSRSINLISIDHLDSGHIGDDTPLPGPAGPLLRCRDATQAIKQGEPIAYDCDRDLRFEFNIASGLTTHDRPDVCLGEADDTVRNTSAV